MDKRFILRRKRGIPKYFNLRAGTTAVIVYAHNIEPPLARWWKLAQILPRYLRNLAPFMPIHRRFRRLHILRRPSLNLHETKYILIPPDQVNLSSASRRAEISRDHRISLLTQIEVRLLLPALSRALMRRPVVIWKHPSRQPIQSSNDDSRASSREHRLNSA